MPKCDFNKVACNFMKIALWHGCSPVNLLYIFRTTFLKDIPGRLLLKGVQLKVLIQNRLVKSADLVKVLLKKRLC